MKKRGLRFPILAVGIVIYLPFTNIIPLVIGGFISYLVNRRSKTWRSQGHDEEANTNYQHSILLACGLVAGASLMGVILAILFAIYQSSTILDIMPSNLRSVADVLGLLVLVYLCVWLYRSKTRVGK